VSDRRECVRKTFSYDISFVFFFCDIGAGDYWDNLVQDMVIIYCMTMR
jgi:hypothetical protein